MDQFKRAKEAYNQIAKMIDNKYVIADGMTLDHLRDRFSVILNTDADTRACRAALVELAAAFSFIEFHRASSEARRILLLKERDSLLDRKIIEIQDSFKDKITRPPAKDILVSMAKQDPQISHYSEMLVHADIIQTILKGLSEYLASQRKIIDGILISLGIEAKLNPVST